MTTFSKMAKYAFAEPFRPFRILLKDGRSIVVGDPYQVHLGIKQMSISQNIADPDPENADIYNRQISLASIDSVEALDKTDRQNAGESAVTIKSVPANSQDILEYVDAEPFQPFRITMASGRTYDVSQPRDIRVGADSVVVFQYRSKDRHVFEKFTMLGLSLIESIEHIDNTPF